MAIKKSMSNDDVAMADPHPPETSDTPDQGANADEDEAVESPQELAQLRKKGIEKDISALNEKKKNDTLKRYAYLLGQTDIFAHFINIKNMKSGDAKALLELQAKPDETQTSKGRSTRRGRKTEQEEDAELLRDELQEDEEGTTTITETPAYVKGGTMRDYQMQGLTWLVSLFDNGINGILADEMGLGKTLQSISFLGYLKHFKGIAGPHLVIVPKSTLHNWVSEFRKWVPDLKVFMFHGNKDERSKIIETQLLGGSFEVCVTSYEIVMLEKSSFKKISWAYIVIDEAHRIKNENSSLSVIVRTIQCRNRLLLTGTPLQNNLHELWSLLNFLLPDVFSSSEDFDKWFETQGGDQDKVVSQLHKVLQPFLLRRIKADVEKSLLPKKRINLYVGLSAMQRQWYQKILEKDIDAVNGLAAGGKREGKTRLQNVVMQLRKCCNHPYLFDGAEPGPPYTTDVHLLENSGKMAILDKLLDRLKASGSRVLLFSQMSRMLDILEDYCCWKGYNYCRIDGNTSHEDRVNSIDAYNKPDSEKFIFLLTTRAGGLGINLATADIVIMYDSDWNPQVDLQAEDRAHRIGQKKQVVVFRFITENAVEEKIIERATQKLRLDQLVIQQGRNVQQSKAASKDELLTMIQHGAHSIFASTDSTVSNDDIEDILLRSEEKTAELEAKYKDAGLDDLQKFTSDGSVYQWEGSDFRSNQKGALGFGWIGPSQRAKKTSGYGVDAYYKEALRIGNKPAGTKAPKPPRTALASDFQFYPTRLLELQEKETLAYRKQIGYKVPKDSDTTDPEQEKQKRLREQERIDNAEPLTEDEIQEKESFANQGFDWSKRDFSSFIKGNEKWGRHNIEAIAKEMEGKDPEEVRRYSQVFWSRYKELADWEKLVARIEEGEAKLQKQQEIQDMLTARIGKLRLPLQQLKIVYGTSKGKNYTEEEDRFLLVALEKLGYGSEEVYEKIREEIKRSTLFRFDWFLKSRTAVEIGRRCTSLISLMMKESDHNDDKEDGQDEPPKKRKYTKREPKEKEAVGPSSKRKKN
ncbi:SNF2 family N-terminal domain-containing protein [Polychytrium aggregatum]|uniref:SNF2 family N-terminal domain-containing protein n=1 Tax=Polychytrium aggregatum TaxID=110093 RepID=UPI0022FE0D8C|nr:SNF2 family N-terminal domain-containing protein [Polychytrium aggregatum]KAI9203985.1 SNF2 family N-terminal domain-containing protein [Polychytrium aggregatum]